MISTLIFDLDGLLADTEKLHRRAYQEVFVEKGFRLDDKSYDDHWIRDGKGIVEYVAAKRLNLDPNDIRPRKAARYDVLVRSNVEPMPGAVAALQSLGQQKRLTLATSSCRDAAYVVLETLGIQAFFEHIATKESAARVKPFPDVFLAVAGAVGIPPKECLVVEDSQKGVFAAIAAGMPCIAVPNAQTKGNDFTKAAKVLCSLEELTLEVIEECGRQPTRFTE